MGLDHGIKVLDTQSRGELIESYLFRKFNALQGYIEEKYSIDNCETIEISMEDIEYLNQSCIKILKEHDDKVSNELLPTHEGFFFGSQSFDDWYYEDVQELLKVTNTILSEYNTSDFKVTYWCWY